jgi:hypothetical protein
LPRRSIPRNYTSRRHVRGSQMRRLKSILCTSALPAPLALVPAATTQVVISVGVQPVCSYGYYDYSPYACAPVGFYGPGYFYNGIFLGMGPWAGWGYSHGWGSHRFTNGGGGSYNGGGGSAANRGHGGSASVVHTTTTRTVSHPTASSAGSHASAYPSLAVRARNGRGADKPEVTPTPQPCCRQLGGRSAFREAVQFRVGPAAPAISGVAMIRSEIPVVPSGRGCRTPQAAGRRRLWVSREAGGSANLLPRAR